MARSALGNRGAFGIYPNRLPQLEDFVHLTQAGRGNCHVKPRHAPLQKFWLIGMVISLASVTLALCVGFVSAAIAFLSGNSQTVVTVSIAMSWIGVIAVWCMILAVWAKRWHDRGKSGWWSLVLLIPMVGPIWALVELGFLKGDYGYNRYGHEDVSSSETVAKWTFWSSLAAFVVVLFSAGIWGIWQAATPLLYPTVGSLIIWLMSRR